MPAAKSSLELRSQVGQLLMMGFEAAEIGPRLRSTLATLQPGGIILFARNVKAPQQTWELLRECRRCLRTPAFLGVDMEGGTVDRMREVIGPAPSAQEVAACGNKKLFRKHGQVIGDECRALGFNTDFAPVLDLGLEPSRKVLTSRTVSDDPQEVVNYAREFLRGLNKDMNVLGCGKHFPGLGGADLDTHFKLPGIHRTWKQLWEEDLFPYRELRRELPFVMVSHAGYPEVTKDTMPASLSKKWMSDVLRKRIGYRGLVVTDDMEMGALLVAASIEDAAVEALLAGADILAICKDQEKVWAAYEAVLTKAERDRRFAAQVGAKAQRILAFKKKSKELKRHQPAPTQEVADRLRRELWELGEQVRLTGLQD